MVLRMGNLLPFFQYVGCIEPWSSDLCSARWKMVIDEPTNVLLTLSSVSLGHYLLLADLMSNYIRSPRLGCLKNKPADHSISVGPSAMERTYMQVLQWLLNGNYNLYAANIRLVAAASLLADFPLNIAVGVISVGPILHPLPIFKMLI